MDMMTELWHTSSPVIFKEICDNGFLCQCASSKDKLSIINGAPWHLDKALVMLGEVTDNVIPYSLSLSKALFWIQVHGIPITCMTKDIGLLIGKKLGMYW